MFDLSVLSEQFAQYKVTQHLSDLLALQTLVALVDGEISTSDHIPDLLPLHTKSQTQCLLWGWQESTLQVESSSFGFASAAKYLVR
jgi:hypothetical protein